MAGEQSSRTSPNLEATTATSLDEFAIRYESELKVASLRGAQGVREFLQQVGPQNRIAFVTPPGTDGVFILSLATRQGGEQGKAYVLPGKFLKRPWIEWFQLPVGSYERVEMTIEPATVAREAEGDWHLVKRGIVKQG